MSNLGTGGGPGRDRTITAAVIGGAAVVAAAFVQSGGRDGDPAPTPTPSVGPATPTPTATPTASLIGPLHEIHMANRCERPFTIMYHYHGVGGWTNNDGATWTYTTGEDDYPTYRDQRLLTDRPEIYIYARLQDGSGVWEGRNLVTVKGREVGFRKAMVEERVNGDYAVVLTCDEPTSTPTATPTVPYRPLFGTPTPTPTPEPFTPEMLDELLRRN